MTAPQPSAGVSLQEVHFGDGMCFGCGPANRRGLGLRSFPDGSGLVAEWVPEPHHEAFPGVLCGGIIGTLLDCHSNWTAWWTLFGRDGIEQPLTVTARYEVKLLRPTALDRPLSLHSEPAKIGADRVEVAARLDSGGKTTATCRGLFVRPAQPPSA